jgi:carbamate kinase
VRIVVALGGNALLKRGEPMTPQAQHTNVRIAAAALADLARDHQIIVAHGNGPQVGLMALRSAAYAPTRLAAGYSGGRNRRHDRLSDRAGIDERPAPRHRLRHAADAGGGGPGRPAFDQPTKPIGPVYSEPRSRPVRAPSNQWSMVEEATGALRRVVPSPLPVAILGITPIRLLVEAGVCVICAGGGRHSRGAAQGWHDGRGRGGDRQGPHLGACWHRRWMRMCC